ncbi:restriction endonuclease [Methanohalobium evestigatum]|uniref:restriction endonuclease n=1 Tax=Methanohalobium evestigatum TaxID=2322 RepID=UPI000677958B|nr:restriction endonuclease [Methanohalobium evestigatum]
MKTNYQNFELISWIKLLQEVEIYYKTRGYHVERTPGTDSGADLIATFLGVEKVAVKICSRGFVLFSSVHEVSYAKIYYRCDRAEVISLGFFSKDAELLAKIIDVKLINRYELEKIIEKY